MFLQKLQNNFEHFPSIINLYKTIEIFLSLSSCFTLPVIQTEYIHFYASLINFVYLSYNCCEKSYKSEFFMQINIYIFLQIIFFLLQGKSAWKIQMCSDEIHSELAVKNFPQYWNKK